MGGWDVGLREVVVEIVVAEEMIQGRRGGIRGLESKIWVDSRSM